MDQRSPYPAMADPADSFSPEDSIDLRYLLTIFRRRFRLFMAIGAITLALVVLVSFQLTPRYRAQAKLIIDPRQEQVIDMNQVLSGLTPDTAVVESEVQIIQSRSLAGKVVDELGLVHDPEFNSDRIILEGFALWRQNTTAWLGNLLPRKVGPKRTEEEKATRTRESAISTALNKLTVGRSGITYVIEVAFESTDPRKAAIITNSFADKYLVDQLESKFDATRRANEWLEDRLGDLRDEVQVAERAVELYRVQEGLLNAEGSSLTEQQIANLTGQTIILRAELAEKRARLRTVDQQIRSGRGEDVSAVLGSPVISDLRRQQSEVTRRQSDLQSRYGMRHPEILKNQSELADVNAQIQSEISRIVSSLRGEVSIARQRLTSLERDVTKLTSKLTTNNSALVRLRELERNANANRTLYESFLDRFKQTSQQQSLLEADARIISRAAIPNAPSFPNNTLILLLGFVLAIGAGGAAIFVAEAMDRGLHTAADIEHELGVPCLASLAKIEKLGPDETPADYAMDKPLSSFSEGLRTMRAALLYADGKERDGSHIVALTSALPGEGKTSMALSLARVSAMMGSRTLVIDADIRRRMLTQTAQLTPEVGLVDIVAGHVPIEKAIIADKQRGLDILPLVDRKENLTLDLFGLPAMRTLLKALKTKYDFIVIDTAPALPVAETRVLATLMDSVVLLVRWRKTPREIAKAALTALQRVHAPVVGVALTQVDLAAQHSYGYGYGYGSYYKNYRKYYSD
ncbi:MAG: capsular biosynthesis protein [Robiginitomaculum sp.]|nr:MAG: capsular biosynthesis protein [Robiginitomaculum sp.]